MPRPAQPRLSRDLIVRTALCIVDAEGLHAVSMRRLAGELGVRAPSLYNHVRTKEEILDAVAEEVTREVDASVFERAPWADALAGWARSYYACVAAHPHVVPLIAASPGRREGFLHRADQVHGGLVAAGWSPRRATEIAAALKYLVLGGAMGSFAASFDDDASLYARRYPHLGQAHRLRAHRDAVDRAAFDLGLAMLVDGLRREHEDVPSATPAT